MRPNPFTIVVDILVRFCTNVIAAPLDRKLYSLQRYRAGRWSNRVLAFAMDFANEPFQKTQTSCESVEGTKSEIKKKPAECYVRT